MVSVRARARAAVQAARTTTTYRQRVLDTIQAAGACLTGHELATRSGLTYRQTVDALGALLDQGRIERHGRKFSARWCPLTPKHDPMTALEAIWRQK